MSKIRNYLLLLVIMQLFQDPRMGCFQLSVCQQRQFQLHVLDVTLPISYCELLAICKFDKRTVEPSGLSIARPFVTPAEMSVSFGLFSWKLKRQAEDIYGSGEMLFPSLQLLFIWVMNWCKNGKLSTQLTVTQTRACRHVMCTHTHINKCIAWSILWINNQKI